MKPLLPLLALLAAPALISAASLPEAQKIDALLAKDWQKNNLTPNPTAPDAVLVRRLYLDIAGRIPTAEETQEFMKSQDPQKRAKLIDRLLASDGYTSNMFNYWADILRLTDNVKGKITAQAYEEWLKQQLKANKPYDQFVRDLLTTDGGVWDSGSIGFYQRDENKLDHLAYTVQVFLGTQIVCAQCHNHPFDKWSQKDYYGMAAFTYGMDTKGGGLDFKGLAKNAGKPQVDRAALKNMTPKERKAYMADQRKEGGTVAASTMSREEMQEVRKTLQDVMKPLRYTSIQWNDNKLPKLPNDYKYPDAKPGEEIAPKVLFGHDAVSNGVETRLQAFADWMTSPDNPRFTTVIANRMWKKAFGIGLIEPVDEMMDSTVPSNNELMEYLNELMVEKKYSLKSFLRVLYNTEAYQRMSTREEVPLGELYHFTGPVLRRMSAEQIWDSFVTLARGSVDGSVGDKDERMHQYLGDLKYLIDTVKDKGAEGLVEVARKGAADREATNAKLESLRKEMEAAQASGNASTAGQLAREANRLRRENSNGMLEAIVGEDRADDLRRGYNPDKKGGKNAVPAGLSREQLATMSKEQRRDAIKMGNSLNLTARASEIASPARPGHLLRTFGQSDREQIQNASDDATVPQALALLNGPTSEVLNSPVSRLRQDVEKATSPQAKIDAIYLACLSRLPSNNERTMLNDVIHERGDRAYGDVIQALLTGSQFVFVQ
ncbi:DUF1549 domain-containing protein [Verrucomicrobium sp. BvORR106]|uniref:DUF1549 domain-containing protein n=1 Tax=Verrucomicrobium sp. BvORR106 TaxID=1403819 RepID=UPI00068ECCD3|nr:DUF1549 domain-containing protein [Verrucomicrobium sp. BvORR106]